MKIIKIALIFNHHIKIAVMLKFLAVFNKIANFLQFFIIDLSLIEILFQKSNLLK